MQDGRLVIYENGKHKELGVVKRTSKNIAFVWYSIGDTAVPTSYEFISVIDSKEAINKQALGEFGNSLAFNSLIERQRRLLDGENTDGLIDVYDDGRLVQE